MITLKPVNEDNLLDIIRLTVREDQKSFVATNTESLLEAYCALASGEAAQAMGIYEGDTPVRFVQFGYGSSQADDPPAARGGYCLWRFMIDKAHQGRGLGRQALAVALEYLQTFPCGPATHCWLSYEPENTVARALYQSMGFAENGQKCGEEIVAVRPLNQRRPSGTGS